MPTRMMLVVLLASAATITSAASTASAASAAAISHLRRLQGAGCGSSVPKVEIDDDMMEAEDFVANCKSVVASCFDGVADAECHDAAMSAYDGLGEASGEIKKATAALPPDAPEFTRKILVALGGIDVSGLQGVETCYQLQMELVQLCTEFTAVPHFAPLLETAAGAVTFVVL